jgi:hypothetical protein
VRAEALYLGVDLFDLFPGEGALVEDPLGVPLLGEGGDLGTGPAQEFVGVGQGVLDPEDSIVGRGEGSGGWARGGGVRGEGKGLRGEGREGPRSDECTLSWAGYGE